MSQQTCWTASFSFIVVILWMTECKWGKGNFNASQSIPCGALLVYCCHSCCLGGHERQREPGGRRTGHHSLTSLKLISWQLAGGKAAISNHQVPDHVTLFPKTFSKSALCLFCLVWTDSALWSTGQLFWCMAPQFWKGWKSPPSTEWLVLWPEGHQTLHQVPQWQ